MKAFLLLWVDPIEVLNNEVGERPEISKLRLFLSSLNPEGILGQQTWITIPYTL